MKPYRMLVLASSSQRGSVVQSLEAWGRHIYADRLELRVCHPLERPGEALGYMAVDWYSWIRRYKPSWDALYFPLWEAVARPYGRQVMGGRELVNAYLHFRPQLIVSVHPYLNDGAFGLAQETLGDDVRLASLCSSWTDGWGLSRHWMSPRAGRWVGRSQRVIRAAYRAGVDPDALETCAFWGLPPRQGPALTRARLRLDEKKLTVLLMNDRLGATDWLPTLKALSRWKSQLQVVVVCGLAEGRRQRIAAWQRTSGLAMRLESDPGNMEEYPALCDVALMSGDADQVAMVLQAGCPIWLTAPQTLEEKLTGSFLQTEAQVPYLPDPAAVAARLNYALAHPEELVKAKERLQALRERHQSPTTAEFMQKFFAWGFFRARLEEKLDPRRSERG